MTNKKIRPFSDSPDNEEEFTSVITRTPLTEYGHNNGVKTAWKIRQKWRQMVKIW